MIHVERHGPVVAIRMARSLFGRPLYWTAAYWVDGLLIDAGPICVSDELMRLLKQLPVSQIVITHGHEDHVGGLAALQKSFPDAPIYAPNRSLLTLAEPDQLELQLYRRLVWGTPEAITGVRSLDDLSDLVRTSKYTLRVVETPGHTREHVSLFEPNQRWLFCGDAFIGGKDEAWSPEPEMFGIVSSLRTLASLKPERLFPGSGNVRRTPLPEIHQKIRQLIQLTQEVGKLEAQGLTVSEIVATLFKEEPRITFWSRGHFSATNLVEACRSYNAIFAQIDDPHMDSPSSGRTQGGEISSSPESSIF
ncbi:MAG: MBL fold metallo-hydrolase [Chloroflexota bacterium]